MVGFPQEAQDITMILDTFFLGITMLVPLEVATRVTFIGIMEIHEPKPNRFQCGMIPYVIIPLNSVNYSWVGEKSSLTISPK